MAEVTIWVWLLLLTQVFFYVSCASVIAAFFLLTLTGLSSSASSKKPIAVGYHYFLISFGQWMSFVGLLAVGLNFLLSVGAFAESGIAGMFNVPMFSIVWGSSLGVAASCRMLAFFILIFCFLFIAKRYEVFLKNKKHIVCFFIVCAFYLLARSFSRAGHGVELPLVLQYILSLHVFLVMLWVGSLYPLYKACYQLPRDELYQLMHNFGSYATWLVLVLLVSGLTVLYFLLHSVDEFFTTIYGGWFLAKLVGVFLVLLLALRHKIYLTPQLLHKKNANDQLAISIKVEALLVLVILLFTFIVSHLVGPEHFNH